MNNFEKLINTECKIKPLEDLKGTIIGIYINRKGTEYQVRYYFNGEQKTDYFFDWEIKQGCKNDTKMPIL